MADRWEATDPLQVEFVARALYAGVLCGGTLEEWDLLPKNWQRKRHFRRVAEDAIHAVNYYREEK